MPDKTYDYEQVSHLVFPLVNQSSIIRVPAFQYGIPWDFRLRRLIALETNTGVNLLPPFMLTYNAPLVEWNRQGDRCDLHSESAMPILDQYGDFRGEPGHTCSFSVGSPSGIVPLRDQLTVFIGWKLEVEL